MKCAAGAKRSRESPTLQRQMVHFEEEPDPSRYFKPIQQCDSNWDDFRPVTPPHSSEPVKVPPAPTRPILKKDKMPEAKAEVLDPIQDKDDMVELPYKLN